LGYFNIGPETAKLNHIINVFSWQSIRIKLIPFAMSQPSWYKDLDYQQHIIPNFLKFLLFLGLTPLWGTPTNICWCCLCIGHHIGFLLNKYTDIRGDLHTLQDMAVWNFMTIWLLFLLSTIGEVEELSIMKTKYLSCAIESLDRTCICLNVSCKGM
jgi:hypothetical protein